jgi:outer membrane protein assembly factor BamE (lipoprotein component of BamABCDE complex)
MNGAMVKFAAVAAGAALLGGCAGLRDHRGAVLDDELVSAIQVGVDNKTSVEKTLGRPSFVGQFTPNDWYYVSRDTTTVAFRTPRVRKQTVLHVNFDQAGNVAAVRTTGPELVASVNPHNDKTPTLGRKKGLLEEIFGNIGTVGSGGTGLPDPGGQ